MNPNEQAAIRTHLANERTVLAYVRTALAFLATGAAFIHFFTSPGPRIAGWSFIAAGSFILGAGVSRFILVRRRLNNGI